MTTRRGFGDEIWRLARSGDAEGLGRAATLLERDAELAYESRRAAAFRQALHGETDRALAELNEGWSEDWPVPSAYAIDVSRIHLLAGNCNHALTALELEAHTFVHWFGVREIAVDCVRRDPALWRRSLKLAVAAEGDPPSKAAAALDVARARLRRRGPAPDAVPDPSPGS